MKHLTYLVLALVAVGLYSCGGKSERELNAEVDSLQTALQQRDADYQQLDEFLTIVSSGLDSISMQETELFNPSKESPTPNQSVIKTQLETLKQTLKTQRERIAQLEQQLKGSTGKNKKLESIIVALKAQVAEKESKITALQEELSDKDVTIEGLRTYMAQLHQQNEAQQEVIATQSQIMDAQTQQLNEAYIIMAPKSALKDAGLLKGGFLKKSKVDFNTIDKNLATTIDIRTTTTINIDSKNAKVLSQMPTDAYTIEQKDKNSSVLRITNPTRFWSVTKYLIIQTD